MTSQQRLSVLYGHSLPSACPRDLERGIKYDQQPGYRILVTLAVLLVDYNHEKRLPKTRDNTRESISGIIMAIMKIKLLEPCRNSLPSRIPTRLRLMSASSSMP